MVSDKNERVKLEIFHGVTIRFENARDQTFKKNLESPYDGRLAFRGLLFIVEVPATLCVCCVRRCIYVIRVICADYANLLFKFNECRATRKTFKRVINREEHEQKTFFLKRP